MPSSLKRSHLIGLFVCHCAVLVLYLVGFGTPNWWILGTFAKQGLWAICTSGICNNMDIELLDGELIHHCALSSFCIIHGHGANLAINVNICTSLIQLFSAMVIFGVFLLCLLINHTLHHDIFPPFRFFPGHPSNAEYVTCCWSHCWAWFIENGQRLPCCQFFYILDHCHHGRTTR